MSFLDNLVPKIIPVRIILPHGSTVDIDMYSLTMSEWDELGESVDDPIAPYVGLNSRGEEIRNYTDPKYLKERRKVESERAFKRLTMGMLRGNNDIEGVLFEDKVKAVKEKLDIGIASALMRWQSSNITESRVRVLNAAERFPGVEKTNNESPVAAGDNSDGMETT